MSRPALRTPGQGRGFSLLELLVVVIIIGVAAGAVRLAVTEPQPLRKMRASAERLAYRIGQVRDRVLLENRERGLLITGEGVYPLHWREGDENAGEPAIVWQVGEGESPLWQPPEQTRLRLSLDGSWIEVADEPPEDALDWQPQIILLPSEDYTPAFELVLERLDGGAVRLLGDGFNQPEVEYEAD